MKKCLFFLPAVAFTIVVAFLTYALRSFLTPWYLWVLLLWVSGILLSRGYAWGCIPGLIPAGIIIYMSLQYTGQTVNEGPIGIALAVWMLVCGFFVWKPLKPKAEPQ